jgi:hypothetical protein
MTDSTDNRTAEPRSEPDLVALREAVAQSAIRVELSAMAGPIIADWARLRHSDELDAAILAWIMSHVRSPDRRRFH